MGRTSTKENKNSYQLAREELGLTREKASELLETIAPERIEKIENERTVPRPDEVLTMAEKYKRPALCNYYCSRQCPIGREYVPQVSVRELSAIGNNVNQIAHWANSKGYASKSEIHDAAVRVNEAYMMVRDAFR